MCKLSFKTSPKDRKLLAVGCVGYDDDAGIERLINSCWKNVDLIFVIHGPFDNWSGDAPEHLEHLDDDAVSPNVICHHTWRLPEHEQRQFYLDFCKEYGVDWLIIADTDEYFHPESDWGEFSRERERVCVGNNDYLYNLKNYTVVGGLLLGLDQPRLLKNPANIHYLNGHHYQLAVNGTEDSIVAKDTLYSVKLCHDPSLRSPERQEKHDQYIKWLRRYEMTKMLDETPKEKENRERCVYAGS